MPLLKCLTIFLQHVRYCFVASGTASFVLPGRGSRSPTCKINSLALPPSTILLTSIAQGSTHQTQQPLHPFTRLRSDPQPILHSRPIQLNIFIPLRPERHHLPPLIPHIFPRARIGLVLRCIRGRERCLRRGVVSAEHLEGFGVSRGPRLREHDVVDRGVAAAEAGEADAEDHR